MLFIIVVVAIIIIIILILILILIIIIIIIIIIISCTRFSTLLTWTKHRCLKDGQSVKSVIPNSQSLMGALILGITLC